MEKNNRTTRNYSDAEFSMESLEDIAIEEIQQQYENEQALIDQVSQDHFGMNDDKIDEAVEILVNEELRCDICRCIPCAMVVKQVTVERMVSNLSKKWDITRSAGNSKIREYVFGYLQNDVEVPTINGEFPDCVLLGVLDLIPDPISSFADPNIRMKTFNTHIKCDTTATTAGAHNANIQENTDSIVTSRTLKISNNTNLEKFSNNMIQEINHDTNCMNRNTSINETSPNQAFIGTKGSNPRNTGNETCNMDSQYPNNIHISTVTMVKNCATSVKMRQP